MLLRCVEGTIRAGFALIDWFSRGAKIARCVFSWCFWSESFEDLNSRSREGCKGKQDGSMGWCECAFVVLRLWYGNGDGIYLCSICVLQDLININLITTRRDCLVCLDM